MEETCLVAMQFVLLFCLSLARGNLLPFQCRQRGLLCSFGRADPLFFQREKHGSSRSLRFLFLLETRENSLKFFSSSGLICSLSLGMQGGNYCGLLPCKRSINFVPIWGRGCRNSFQKVGMKEWVCFVLSGIIYFKKFSEFLFSIPLGLCLP